jgi:glycosyltransferase involved in cell wall biosynthesis
MACDWFALRQMDATVAVCNAQADKLIAGGIQRDRIFAIRNAIAAPAVVEVPPQARETLESLFPKPPARIIGTAARLSVEKGIDVLVQAAEIVTARFPSAGFVVFGDGPQRARIEKMIADRDLSSSFVLAGFRSDVQTLFPAFDIAALPSRSEGLPVAILEAMSVGIPVVATSVDGIPEAVVDGDCGYLVPSEDHVALAERLLELLESDERRAAFGARGRERVLSEFTFPVQAEKYAAVYDHAIQQRSHPARAEAS